MKKLIFIIILISTIFISGCTIFSNKPTCNLPYILVGNDCCLDQNNNKICDKDETQEIKDKIEQQKSVEKLKEVVSNASEEDVYNIISKAFEKYCWMKGEDECIQYEQDFIGNNVTCLKYTYIWAKGNPPNPNCNTDIECITYFRNFFHYLGGSKEEIDKEINKATSENRIKCSLEQPS